MTEDKQSTTERLTSVLKNTRPGGAGEVLKGFSRSLVTEERPFTSYFRGLLKAKKLRQQDVFLIADIPERYGYKLISCEKTTRNRDVLLRLFLAAGLSLEEVQRALKLYEAPALYPRFPRDAVLMIAINSGLRDPYEVDELLVSHGMEPLDVCGEAL